MDRSERFTINASAAGRRIDQFLAERYSKFSRSYFNKLCKQKYVLVNNASVKSGYILREADTITVTFHRDEMLLEPADIPIDIVYEDAHILIVNKAAGIAVHPGKGTENDTLVNALLYHIKDLPEFGQSDRPGIVHRLDKFTSGLMVVAKSEQAMRHLRAQFDQRTIHRTYWSLVWGRFEEESGTVETFIDRSRRDPTKFAAARTGKHAVTHWKVLKNFMYISLLELQLDTGRTHQIRVHMNYLHHPVLGDGDYNGRDSQLKGLPPNLQKRGKHILKLLPRQALHARKLSFIHPGSGEEVSFETELPEDFKSVLEKLPQLLLLD